MKIAQLHADVTVNIIKDLEAGTAAWTKPWKNGNKRPGANHVSVQTAI